MVTYKKEGLRELSKELERQQKTKKDYVVDTRTLHAMVVDKKLKLEVTIDEENRQQFSMTQFAHEQLADKCGIPKAYYTRMQEEKKTTLLSENINAWIQSKERRMLRTLDGKIRAIVSDRYKCLDNYDVFFSALEKFKEHNVDLLRADLTDRSMYIKGIVNDKTEYITDQDPLQRGILISNSEVGSGAFRVEPFLYRIICQNGMVGEFGIRKFHLGSRHDVGEIFSEGTLELEDKAMWSKVKDVIDRTFDDEFFINWIKEIKETKEMEIIKPTKAIDYITMNYQLPETAKEDLLDFFSLDNVAGNNVWGLANCVTRYAKKVGNCENQIMYERFGSRILSDKDLQEKILSTQQK